MLLTRALLRPEGQLTMESWMVAVGLAAFAGHLYPVWLGFKGGKGVATALGVFAVLSPISAVLAFFVFAVVYGGTRVAALGSLAGTAVCCAGAVVQAAREHGGLGPAFQGPMAWAAVAVAVVIFVRHRSNIERLLRGAEHKV